MGLAFERLCDRCDRDDWDVELDWGKRGWTLSVRDDRGELLARNRSTLPPPECFDRMAVAAAVSLTKQR